MSELRYNTQRTIAGSRINRLDSQLRETKERLANTETRADNLYKESNAHRDLHEEAYRLDTRKNLIEQTLDRDLKVRVRDNAELLREEMAVRIRTDQAAIAQSELDNVHKRARAGYNTDGLLADDMVVNADVTARAQSISKLAGESAERVEKTNIYTDLANQANSAAALAGSIDPYGEERARASATAAIDKMNSENVAAASTLLSSQNYTPAELIAVARGRRRDGTRSTSEEQQAAAQQIIQIGYEPDMVQLINNTTMEAKAAAHAGIPNPDNVALQKALGSYLAGSSKKPKYFPGPMLGKLSRGEMVEDVGDLIASTFASEKLSMEVFGEMPVEEMQRITGQLASTSGRRKLTAAGALDTPAKKTAVIDTITDALADPIVSAKFTPAQAKALDDMLVELRSMP